MIIKLYHLIDFLEYLMIPLNYQQANKYCWCNNETSKIKDNNRPVTRHFTVILKRTFWHTNCMYRRLQKYPTNFITPQVSPQVLNYWAQQIIVIAIEVEFLWPLLSFRRKKEWTLLKVSAALSELISKILHFTYSIIIFI